MLLDLMKVLLSGRAAEQIVFGAVTNGAANDLERVTDLAREMIFEFGMGDEVSSRTMRADNYALSEHTKRVRDEEQARLCDHAFEEAVRLLTKHRRSLDVLAAALLEKETLNAEQLVEVFAPITKRPPREVWLSSELRHVSDRPPVMTPKETAALNGHAVIPQDEAAAAKPEHPAVGAVELPPDQAPGR